MNPERYTSMRRNLAHAFACLLGFAMIASAACVARTDEQRTFASAQAAIDALMQAVNANDEAALHTIFGPDSGKLLHSGDAVADAHNRGAFAKAYAEAHRLETVDATQVTLVVGKDQWPMPIPLVKAAGTWHFDTQKGAGEILARRIGRNELSAMKACLAIADAERDYATQDLDKDGVPEYASRFVSAPGKHDGLYWPTHAPASPSPLGAFLAAAADDGYMHPGKRTLEPYHGYYYRILTRQGKDAPGGARNYTVRGKLIGGFALLAYPARYGDSGIMTFLVGDDGVTYQKNLGRDTATVASALDAFDPDPSWTKVKWPQ